MLTEPMPHPDDAGSPVEKSAEKELAIGRRDEN